MKFEVILSLVSPIVLSAALLVLWKVRRSLPASGYMLAGLAVMIFGRTADAIVGNLRYGPDYPVLVAVTDALPAYFYFLSDCLEAFGALVLVAGFLHAVTKRSEEQHHIETLETLLPICATCKRIRNADNSWDTIEEYLEKSGSPPLTHGICPTCKDELLRNVQK